MEKLRNYLLLTLVALVIFGGSLLCLCKSPQAYSLSERRSLAQIPALSAETLRSGKFMTQFEDYALDQFPARDTFRSLKAHVTQDILRQKANHGLYVLDGYLSKLDYPIDAEKLSLSLNRLRSVYDRMIKNTDCRTYLALIPDKNYFLAPRGGYPVMNYALVAQQLRETLPEAEEVELFSLLSLEDYYRTDQHWRQEAVVPVAQRISEAMGASLTLDFEEIALDVPFYGAYCGQAALKFAPDDLHYLTNAVLRDCRVTSYNTGLPMEAQMYDLKKAEGRDPYEMFLCGADALVMIENPNATTDQELVIFRDSFASSLAPLLTSGYAKITLIDLRYLRSDQIENYVNFEKQDVLFLYSALVLNSTAL